MAFQYGNWNNETKSAPTNAQEIQRIHEAKQEARRREEARVAAYREQKAAQGNSK